MAAVNNKFLTVDSYVRLVEMMDLTFNSAFGGEVNTDNPNIDIKKYGNILVFTPKADPMDFETLRDIYRLQKFA
jgi:hypothetical protein